MKLLGSAGKEGLTVVVNLMLSHPGLEQMVGDASINGGLVHTLELENLSTSAHLHLREGTS